VAEAAQDHPPMVARSAASSVGVTDRALVPLRR
jgi:hypothetical protein